MAKSTVRITKWTALKREATATVAKREKQIRAARPLRLRALDEGYKLLATRPRESYSNNRGVGPDRIVRYAQGTLGEAYCVGAVIWAYGHAGSKVVRPGYTRAVRFMRVSGVVSVGRAFALAGDIVRYSFDHTGLFVCYCDSRGKKVSRVRATHILALEGNTGPSGALQVSDGTGADDGYYLKLRPLGQVSDFLKVLK